MHGFAKKKKKKKKKKEIRLGGFFFGGGGGGGISNFLEWDKGGLLKFLRDERRVAIFFLHLLSKEALFCGFF